MSAEDDKFASLDVQITIRSGSDRVGIEFFPDGSLVVNVVLDEGNGNETATNLFLGKDDAAAFLRRLVRLRKEATKS